MERYICIHAHFYQPPRENPWLEAIEVQDSAYPYHDWNERITAECYAPNAASRILDGEGRITKIVNDYSRISFNFGPTLLSWLEEKAPEVYRAVLAADRESAQRFSGHGSALAQAYNHIILPLANLQDKHTQILWGLRDFRRRFERDPEGMWLPEAAVDLETLEILAAQGIQFTVLAPNQARRVRAIGGRAWRDVSGGRSDPSMAYRLRLRSGRTISLFFYDGPVSRAVAFEGLLQQGESFANRLNDAFSESRNWPQIVHIATDGETYGHHHRYGDMALAYALEYVESKNLARITNYAEYLERHPPTHEVEIYENSSWSCIHGVERWRSNCGCNSGMKPGWNQEWRAPLREALDWLRDALAPLYSQRAAGLLRDPWIARNSYIDVVLDRSPENVDQFLERHAVRPLSDDEKTLALKLLELQRHAMLMYTSCGWFFDELSGIETVQVIQYAGRALQLAGELFEEPLEAGFLDLLGKAKSNVPAHRDGRLIYEKFVRPAAVDLYKVGVHYAVSSLFESYEAETQTFCYNVNREDYRLMSAGKAKLAIGRATISSAITREAARMTFGVMHMGDHNVSGGVREFRGEEAYQVLAKDIVEVFERGDFPELLRLVEKNYDTGTVTLKLLFRDEQRKILRQVLESALGEAEASYRHVYENYAPLMRFVTALNLPLPKRFQIAAEFTLNADLRKELEAESLDLARIESLLAEAGKAGITLDEPTLEFSLRRKIEEVAQRFRQEPGDIALLQELGTKISLAQSLPFEINLWAVQNLFYDAAQDIYPEVRARAEQGDEGAAGWVEHFRALGGTLRVRVD
jgi:alpha-amylase/alpha-mannosidase (GH57 family)